MKLFVVPTPVGNREDITLRALRILKEVGAVVAEDTRNTGLLLRHYGISTGMRRYHMHNEHKVVDDLVSEIEGGTSMALVTDAGTPGISDPGFLLIRGCIRKGIPIECLPGATAFVPALVGSGLPCDRFAFEGFLPVKKGRKTKLQTIAESDRTTVFYEAPHRLLRLLSELEELCEPDRPICVAREISKMHENYHRGTAADLLTYFELNPPKGEIAVVLGGRNSTRPNQTDPEGL